MISLFAIEKKKYSGKRTNVKLVNLGITNLLIYSTHCHWLIYRDQSEPQTPLYNVTLKDIHFRLLFFLCLLATVLSVLRITASDYHFSIFKLFLLHSYYISDIMSLFMSLNVNKITHSKLKFIHTTRKFNFIDK